MQATGGCFPVGGDITSYLPECQHGRRLLDRSERLRT
jgi:hypothetical protein